MCTSACDNKNGQKSKQQLKHNSDKQQPTHSASRPHHFALQQIERWRESRKSFLAREKNRFVLLDCFNKIPSLDSHYEKS